MANRYRTVKAGLATLLALISGAPRAGGLTILAEHAPPASMLVGDAVGGRETEKVREALRRTGTDYHIDLLPWKRAYLTALKQAATCVYSTSRTPEREQLFKWVGPTDEAEWVLFGLKDHSFPLRRLEDARALRIGTYNGDARDDYLRSRGYHVDPSNNDLSNPQKLLLKRIDLWAVGMRTGSQVTSQYQWSDRIVPLLVFNRVKVYLACNPGVPDRLVEQLNAAIADMRRDGSMARIERKYEGWTAPR